MSPSKAEISTKLGLPLPDLRLRDALPGGLPGPLLQQVVLLQLPGAVNDALSVAPPDFSLGGVGMHFPIRSQASQAS